MRRAVRLTLLAGIVLVAIAIRSYQLTARSIWFDEAFTWGLIQFPWSALVSHVSQDVHPPLYYVLIKLWAIVFGSSLLALRSFSITVATLLVIAVYGFTRTISRTPSTALVAALLVAISSWQIALSTEARMYALAALLTVGALWALYRHQWPIFAALAILLVYTHYYGLLVLAAALLWFAGQQLVRARFRLGEIFTSQTVWYGIASLSIVVLAYIPWLPVLLEQVKNVQHAFWIPALTKWSVPETLYRMLLGPTAEPHHDTISATLVTLLPIIGLVILCVVALFKKQTLLVTIAVGTLALSVGISLLSQSIYQDRYFLPIHSLLLILLAIIVGELRPPLLKNSALAALMLFFAFGTYQHYQKLDLAHRPGMHGAITQLATQNQEQAPIVVSSPFIFFPMLYYQTEEFTTLPPPQLSLPATALTHFAGTPILQPTNVLAPDFFTRQPASSFWVVDTTGFNSTPLTVPATYQETSAVTFPEVYPVQGDVTLRHYTPVY